MACPKAELGRLSYLLGPPRTWMHEPTSLIREFFLQCVHLRFILTIIDSAVDLFS
jgi:hypothetical protein